MYGNSFYQARGSQIKLIIEETHSGSHKTNKANVLLKLFGSFSTDLQYIHFFNIKWCYNTDSFSPSLLSLPPVVKALSRQCPCYPVLGRLRHEPCISSSVLGWQHTSTVTNLMFGWFGCTAGR